MQTSPLLSGAEIGRPELGGSKLGRSVFPLLLILLPLVADAAIVRCPAGSCRPAAQFTGAPSTPTTGEERLEFPFPLDRGMAPESDITELSPGFGDELLNPEASTGQTTAEVPSGGAAPTRSTGNRAASAVAPPVEGPAATQAADDTPPIPWVEPPATTERATREYRSYSPAPDRRTYSHPDAGSAGGSSSFQPGAPAPSSQQAPTVSTGSIPSSSTAPAPAPPPPPPPNQGSPGTFSPGEPGDPAGFIG